MIALVFIKRFPKARAMVTIAGSASGMAATASETEVNSMDRTSSPLNQPIRKIEAQIKRITMDNCFQKRIV
jgi:hypothetical protein